MDAAAAGVAVNTPGGLAMARHYTGIFLAECFLAALAPAARAQMIYTTRTSFLADPAVASSSTTTINFDGFAPGTDLTNQTVSGVTLAAPGSSPLQVILAATGVRNPMSPSTPLNVLSPGGNSTTLEDDDLAITFGTPVRAAGLDVVFDQPDGASFTSVTFFDALNAILGTLNPIPAPTGAPGFQFVGMVSTSANIKRIVFDESDGSAPDDHIAYDTLTFTSPVPEPGGLALCGLAAAGVLSYRRRKVAADGGLTAR
jgi:hypothetical protein